MNHKLESRFPGELSKNDTTQVAQSEEELKSLLMKLKEESGKQRSWHLPHHFMANRWRNSGKSG